MRKEIADMVFAVFRSAIEIKEGLRTDESKWNFADSQKKLLALLQAPIADDLRGDVFGEQRSLEPGAGATRLGFRGVRYALACWLDEIFIEDSPWKDQWNSSKLETTLFSINERASEFWRQAQRAQNRSTRDVLEVYYLCVMLGFRGELIDRPADLLAWRETTEAQITQGEERQYTPPPGLGLTPNVRQLKGAGVMQKWFMIVSIVGLLYIPLVIFLVRNVLMR